MFRFLSQPPPPPREGAALLKWGRDATQPDIWRLERDERLVVWKTFRARGALSRATIGRWLAGREARALRRLDGIEGVPRLLAMPEPWTIEMTCLASEPIPEKRRRHGLGPEYFATLSSMLAEMHSRGMNHGDLRRKNLLRDPRTGRPALVDFAQSLVFTNPRALPGRWFLAEAARVDRVTLAKLKRWYLGPASLTREEAHELANPPWHLRLGQFLRNRVYRPLKHLRGSRRK